MSVRVGINGFGRIGRLVLRALYESGRKDLKVVAINDLAPAEGHAHLLKYDSAHGRFPFEVNTEADNLVVNGDIIAVSAQPDPAQLPWKNHQVDLVLECSGVFADSDKAHKHIEAGAKKVLISAPAKGVPLTVVYGVNHKQIKPEHDIVSNASCTTNCLAPVAAILHQNIGIEHGYMTTIHAYTGDQRIVDTYHKDLHRARAAAVSMIPTTTGAAKAVGLVLPELKGKLDGTAIRVPVVNVSLVDFVFRSKRATTIDEINQLMIDASSEDDLKGILDASNEPLVSVDFNHSAYSSNFDLTQTQIIEDRLCRVLSWYDNEWGFSNRMLDTAAAMGQFLK